MFFQQIRFTEGFSDHRIPFRRPYYMMALKRQCCPSALSSLWGQNESPVPHQGCRSRALFLALWLQAPDQQRPFAFFIQTYTYYQALSLHPLGDGGTVILALQTRSQMPERQWHSRVACLTQKEPGHEPFCHLLLLAPGPDLRPLLGPAPPECIVEWTTPPSSVVFGLCFFKYWGFEALLQPRPSASACLTYWCPSDLSLRKAAAENCFKRQLSPKVLTTPKALLSRGQCQFFEKSLKLI